MKELSKGTQRGFFIVLWAMFIIPVIIVTVIFYRIANHKLGEIPDFDELENPKSSLASQIYSADGVLLGKFL